MYFHDKGVSIAAQRRLGRSWPGTTLEEGKMPIGGGHLRCRLSNSDLLFL